MIEDANLSAPGWFSMDEICKHCAAHDSFLRAGCVMLRLYNFVLL